MNCNAEVCGKYCHICGQENLEPAESVWHLVTHFFNDITHFDGKFFTTLGLLITKPGFLSTEYKRGRRNSYLNPVRMYIFTSFIFFFTFFSTVFLDESMFEGSYKSTALTAIARLDSTGFKKSAEAVIQMDSMEFRSFTLAINNGKSLSQQEFKRHIDSIRKTPVRYYEPSPTSAIIIMDSATLNNFNIVISLMDSAAFKKFAGAIYAGDSISKKGLVNYIDSSRASQHVIMGGDISFSRKSYDSLTKKGSINDNWFIKRIRNKVFDINDKYRNYGDKVFSGLINTLIHNFPQMLFVSLPLFALFLKLIYYRHKQFYFVSHGIYSIHLYIFYFIVLLAMIGLDNLADYAHWPLLTTLSGLLTLVLLLYEYKAMRNFYGQGRFKTIIKFLFATTGRFILIILLFVVFLFFSLLKV